MRQPPDDKEEESRARSIFEQCWLGPLFLFFWVIAILAVFHGCSKGAECKLAWDTYPGAIAYSLFCGDRFIGTVDAPVTQLTVELPDAPCELSLVAVKTNGQSAPATLKVSYITDQESVDMRAWATMRGYYTEFLPGRRFYRTTIQTPP